MCPGCVAPPQWRPWTTAPGDIPSPDINIRGEEFHMALSVGRQAPDFKLKSSKMQDVALSSLRGKNVMLLFVPLAFTGT